MKHLVLVLLLTVVPRVVCAQVATHDAITNLQSIINTARQLVQEALSYERQGQQLLTEYNQLVTMGRQLETMAQNLRRMPSGLNFAQDILVFGQRLSGVLDATQGLSFAFDRATQQFTTAFETLDCSLTDDAARDAIQEMERLQMGTVRTGVQLQSISDNLGDIFGRLCALLNGIFGASGNLDTLQESSQQQAIAQQLAAQAAARQAASERAQALAQAATIARDRIGRCLNARFLAPRLPGTYVVQGDGSPLSFHW